MMKIAKVTFRDIHPMKFVLGQDGNQKTSVKHNFDCLQTSPCGFGDTYKDAVCDLCSQLKVTPVHIFIDD